MISAAPGRPVRASLAETGARIRQALEDYLAAVATAYPDRRPYLCLSGGLDSSTIAAVARRHFPSLTAISFDLASPGRCESADRVAARRLADDLGIPLIESTVTVDRSEEHKSEPQSPMRN